MENLGGLNPVCAGGPGGFDDDTVVNHAEFDLILQAGLLEQRLGDADATGVADANQPRLHGPSDL